MTDIQEVLAPIVASKVEAANRVEVRPLPIQRWHNKKNKESFTQPKAVEVLLDEKTGNYATGLTEEETAIYGRKLGVDLSSKYDPNEPHPYWATKASWVYLPNQTQVFDMSKPRDFVKVKNMKASKFVANSLQDWKDGKYPDATHYIYDEEEQAAGKANKIEKEEEAIIFMHNKPMGMRTALIQILTNKSARGRSPEYVNVEINRLIKEDPFEFLRVAKMSKDEIVLRSALLEAILKGHLTKDKTIISFMGEPLGNFEQALTWFKDPSNAASKLMILEKINI